MILDLTRSHCTSHEIPGFWALLLETSETDEHLFFPLSIYYIWSSCLQMKIFWLLQPKSNVHLSPPQDLDTRPKFQLLGNWVREWNTNIRMIAVMQKHDEFLEQRKTNSEKSKTKSERSSKEKYKDAWQRILRKNQNACKMVERKCQKLGLPTLLSRVFAPILKLKVKEKETLNLCIFLHCCLLVVSSPKLCKPVLLSPQWHGNLSFPCPSWEASEITPWS